MKKIKEDTDDELMGNMTARRLTQEQDEGKGPINPVYSSVKKTLSLMGDAKRELN